MIAKARSTCVGRPSSGTRCSGRSPGLTRAPSHMIIGLAVTAFMLTGCDRTKELLGTSAPNICGELEQVIYRDVADIAVAALDGRAAPSRQANIQANLLLLSQHKCPPHPAPVDPFSFYPESVLQCALARLEMSKSAEARVANADQRVREACDSRKWRRVQ